MSRPTMGSLHQTEEFTTRERWDDLPSEGPDQGAPDQVKSSHRFWGKWPGVVVQPIDPEGRGRLLVSVTDVFGPNVTSWAWPCLPYGGLSLGMFIVPMVGANVWVEFLHGNPDFPIWTGFWYGSLATAPVTPKLTTPGTPQLTIESLLKHAVVISDTPIMPFLPLGGILLKSGTSYIAIEPTGVRIFGTPVGVVVNSLDGTPATAGLHVL
jgi:hypothetical protein